MVRLKNRDTGGIIPARAGFTRRPPCSCPPGKDHPRSRGVYSERRTAPREPSGSSPLARGLPFVHANDTDGLGIIPARAGFTAGPWVARTRHRDHPRSRGVYSARRRRRTPGPDHPRSRGVYWPWTPPRTSPPGSSPLARGLLVTVVSTVWTGRIIPARAGFTSTDDDTGVGRSDHPRSRGVYGARFEPGARDRGSSPLARGLQEASVRLGGEPRIIPARAGFTIAEIARVAAWGDHPRSRGVYCVRSQPSASDRGSSPLARGLQAITATDGQAVGIIPARAGFTRGVHGRAGAHPGSSPLARGLPPGPGRRHSPRRIIPARAGFTGGYEPGSLGMRDHPRSRGVYG